MILVLMMAFDTHIFKESFIVFIIPQLSEGEGNPRLQRGRIGVYIAEEDEAAFLLRIGVLPISLRALLLQYYVLAEHGYRLL